eukprot:12292318-Ditylum_brightwellii.AAC.1
MEHRKLEGRRSGKKKEYKQIRSHVKMDYTADQCNSVKRVIQCLNQLLTVVPTAANNSLQKNRL